MRPQFILFLIFMVFPIVALEAQGRRDNGGLMISSLQEGQYSTWITLSNGSIWLYHDKGGFQKAWFIGDKVELKPTKSPLVWMLFNKSYSSSYPVTLEETGTILPKLIDVENEGLWLQLSDGTLWNVAWWDAILKNTKRWSIGDTLLVIPSSGDGVGEVVIINPNRGMEYVNARPAESVGIEAPVHEEREPGGGVGKQRPKLK